jgi:hypothetical protein
MNFNPQDYVIFEGIIGSNLYGTATKDSDLDIRAVCNTPLKVIINPFEGFEQKDSGFEEEDKVIYDIGKFFKLCTDSNPNITEILFVPESKMISKSKEWNLILENRDLFLSKKAKYTFLGFSYAQLKKAKVHREWFKNPPKEKPTRKMFGLTDSPVVSGESLQVLSNIKLDFFKEEFKDEVKREVEYRNTKRRWDDYVSWKENRNPARMALEEKYGYDTKSMLHVFRLLEEGRQLLLTGEIEFPLQNAEELLEIKHGKYSYEEALEKASNMEKEFEKWYNVSTLPHHANKKALTELYYKLVLGE